ncbi:MAG: hypothetical protein ACFFAU_19040 [Candidatus Hodarchaeota archaeon]
MVDSNKDEKTGHDQFLLQEYQFFANSHWKSEEIGERRLNFFASLVTAVLAGLFVFLTNPPQSNSLIDKKLITIIAYFILFALLLFGFLTLNRIIKRNFVSDGFKMDLERVRRYFKEEYRSSLGDYELRHKIKPRNILTGGLADTIISLNSIIIMVIFALTAISFSLPIVIISGFVGFTFAFSWQFSYITIQYEKNYKKRKKKKKEEDLSSETKIRVKKNQVQSYPEFLKNLGISGWRIFKGHPFGIISLIFFLFVILVNLTPQQPEVLVNEPMIFFSALLTEIFWICEFLRSLLHYKNFQIIQKGKKYNEKEKKNG